MNDIYSALVAFVICLLVMPGAIRLSEAVGAMDVPGHRSSHVTETPRLGGVAVMVGALGGLLVAALNRDPQITVFLFPFGLGILGLVEDLRGLPVTTRLPLQIILALIAVPFFIQGLTGIGAWRVLFTVGAFIWLIAYANAFNFMDGINGISVVQTLIAGVTYAVVGLSENEGVLVVGGLTIAGAVVGFAPFNFPAARSFLGDVGSYLLGGWIAVLLLVGLRRDLPPETMIAPIALYLVDTGWTLVRRARAGHPLLQPHREHVYQRLVRLGWSHSRTTAVVGLLIACMSLIGGLGFSESVVMRSVGALASATLLAFYVCLPRLVSARRTAGA